MLAACCGAGALVASTPAAFAFSSGIGSSFFGPAGCNDCHSGGQKPAVSLTGPTQLAPGAVETYTLSWSPVGTQNKGGFNV